MGGTHLCCGGGILQPHRLLFHPSVNLQLPPLLHSWTFQHTIYTSSLRNPLSAAGLGFFTLFSFFFFLTKHLIPSCTGTLQPYTVFTLFSVWILQAAIHNYLHSSRPSERWVSTLIWTIRSMWEKCLLLQQSHCLFCFVCYLALNLMTAESDS